MTTENWTGVADLADLEGRDRKIVKAGGKQILLLKRPGPDGDRIIACNNRCPHEGYPLAEGSVTDSAEANADGAPHCIVTCNWHNWKFDLDSGETLVGGDALRRYPVRVEDGKILLDLSDPPAAIAIAKALDNLTGAFDRHEYDRIAREVARLMKAGGDPLDALRRTIAVTHDRFEYGATHALPATSDWLSLRKDASDDPVRSLAMLTESIGHFVWDSRREPAVPYPGGTEDWDEDAFVTAVEAEDEAKACALVRGAVAAGLGWPDMERGFARAALAHYQDFGHSAIYTYKMRALTAALGDPESLRSLALLLTRSLVFASREDLIPEFRAYAGAIDRWDGTGNARVREEDLRKGSVKAILTALSNGSGDMDALYDAAMGAGAWQLLHFDLAWQDRTDSTVSQNVGWLDFTHTLTFGNAARKLAETNPDLWPAALLQIGCFLGRNSGFTDADLDEGPWRTNDPVGAVTSALRAVEDHGKFEYIVSSHLLKLSYAILEEMTDRPDAPWHGTAAAALTRFLNSPLKRKHTLRTAHQALEFVDAEG